MRKSIIMVSGSSFGAGKDTLAAILKKKYEEKGLKVRTVAFADWVRDSLKRYYNWDGQKDAAGRTLMQTYATDTVRATDENYWADVTARLALATVHDWDILIVTDMRFPNEYTVMTKYFNINAISTVRVDRGEVVRDGNREHISEHSLERFGFDYIIDNNGTLEDLEKKVGKLFEALNA